MKAIRRIFMLIAILAIIVFIGYSFFINVQKRRICSSIEECLFEIDQIFFDWAIDLKKSVQPTKIEAYMRNKSPYDFDGDFVFEVTLKKKGLKEAYIERIIQLLGEESLIEKEGGSGKLKAIQSYIKRDKELPEGLDYEPVEDDSSVCDYVFTFRHRMSLKSGEVQKFSHEVSIPPKTHGYLFEIKLVDIESSGWMKY
jgi:hypothetical protein